MLKNRLIFFIKLVLSISLLYWLYISNVLDIQAISMLTLNYRTVSLIAINSILLFLGIIIMTFRLWYLLRLMNFDIVFSEVFHVNIASMCLGLMLPGLMGVDAIRATYFCMQTEDRKVHTLMSILFDRLIGLYALILLASCAACIGWLLELESIHIEYLIFSTSVLIIVTVVFAFLASKSTQQKMPFIINCLPNVFQNIIFAFQYFIKFKKEILLLILVSLISQMVTITCFVIIGLIIHDNLPILAHFIINPIALLLNAVPLTPGGVGITESAFAYLYHIADSDNGAVISLLGRINLYSVYIIFGLPSLFLLKWNSKPLKKSMIRKN